jgi:hypothetical protein
MQKKLKMKEIKEEWLTLKMRSLNLELKFLKMIYRSNVLKLKRSNKKPMLQLMRKIPF